MGQESQGMILAASDANGDMKLIEPNGEMPAGSIVK
jgi:tRNA-binding EMAP/Myf-like protein